MATQKPGEWANTLIVRFEEQVSANTGDKQANISFSLLINIYMTVVE